ncbi:MAG: DUF2141 domain-containing protein [Chlorobi bacterium]|nr:DUF2141 domain-containing protein [Chlorobiota bacterium]
MKKIILSLMALALLTISCNKETEISANLTWTDVDYFELSDNWQVSIYSGAINFINDSDYDLTAIDTKSVSVGDATVVFNVTVSTYENFTIVAFNDSNGNGKYDLAEPASVKFDGVDSGEAKAFDLTINY